MYSECLGTGFASETELSSVGPMEMFMPEPDFEDSLLQPNDNADNDVTTQGTLPEPTVKLIGSGKFKKA